MLPQQQHRHEHEAYNDDKDIFRAEETWTTENERLLERWTACWQKRLSMHNVAGTRQRRFSYCIAVPTTAIPLIFPSAIGAGLVSSQGASAALGCLALLRVLEPILKFSEVAAGHRSAAQHYSRLILDVDELLCKARMYRPDCDFAINNFKCRWDDLILHSPAVPTHDDDDDDDDDLSLIHI